MSILTADLKAHFHLENDCFAAQKPEVWYDSETQRTDR